MKKIYLVAPDKLGTIAPEIYGHFTEQIGGMFYDGLWVGKDSPIPNIRGFRKDLVEKLKAIRPPVLRWPGGCFAESYDWRDGIGENRPTRLSWWTGLDNRYESNAVGTHEFCDLCEIVGAKPYFAANLTSTTPQHIRDWMEYCLAPRGSTTLALEREKNGHPEPFNIPYWGVGNENWGAGGNMRPEYYADECRRFGTIMHNVDKKAHLFACGTDAKGFDWALGVIPSLRKATHYIDGFAMHYYCRSPGGSVDYTDEEWDQQMVSANEMEMIIKRNWNIISAYDTDKHIKLVIDEWGCWHDKQQSPSNGYNLFEQYSTMRDAMVAALTLNIFNNHCEKIRMANVAQLNNNLHSLFLSGGENCIATPNYYVFDMYKEHQGAEAIRTVTTNNEEFSSSVSVSASIKDGFMLITMGNLSCKEAAEVSLESVGVKLAETCEAILLAADDIRDHNTFDNPNAVTSRAVDIDPTKPFTIPKAGILSIRAKIAEK